MSLKNKVFKEMFKMSSPAAEQAGTKAPSHNLGCWIQPNSPKSEKSRPNPTQPNPWVDQTHGQLWLSFFSTSHARH